MIYIEGLCETYSVDHNGNIGRPAINMPASGGWKLRGLVRYNNFWQQVEFVPWGVVFSYFGDGRDLLRKNGKPQWFMADLDHGTPRVMMEGVRRVYGP